MIQMIKADITGQRFGRLTAVRFTGRSSNSGRAWHCACDCGGSIVAYVNKLKDGGVVSCGCSRRKHGLTRSRDQWHPLYQTSEEHELQELRRPRHQGVQAVGRLHLVSG
jgi:hypothetical protein